jgi:hypothetical protein
MVDSVDRGLSVKHLLLLAGSLVLLLGFVRPHRAATPNAMLLLKLPLAHGEVWQRFYADGGLMSFQERAPNARGRVVPNGRSLTFHTDGSILTEGSWLDGRENGTWTSYWASGRKQSEGEYRRGLQHGIWRYWNADGEAASVDRWIDGRRVAPWLSRSRGAPRLTEEDVACFVEEYGDLR